jgi:hypothetical protein
MTIIAFNIHAITVKYSDQKTNMSVFIDDNLPAHLSFNSWGTCPIEYAKTNS